MRIRIGYEAIRKRTTYPYRDNLSAKAGTARTRAVACGAGVNLSASAGRGGRCATAAFPRTPASGWHVTVRGLVPLPAPNESRRNGDATGTRGMPTCPATKAIPPRQPGVR